MRKTSVSLMALILLAAATTIAHAQTRAEPNNNQRAVLQWLKTKFNAAATYAENGPEGFDYIVLANIEGNATANLSNDAREALRLDETPGAASVFIVNPTTAQVIGAAQRLRLGGNITAGREVVNQRTNTPYNGEWAAADPPPPTRPSTLPPTRRASRPAAPARPSASGYSIECTSYERGNTSGVRCVDSDGRITGHECTSYGSGATFGIRCRDL